VPQYPPDYSGIPNKKRSIVAAEWCVYILRCSDESFYTGITNNLEHRIETHNNGKGAKYTRSRRPVQLAWSKAMPNRSAAASLEIKIKRMSRKSKLELIQSCSQER